jgi:hypothetical protein
VSKVISIHSYQFKPGITTRDITDAISKARELELFDLPGLESYCFMIGIKGQAESQWSAIWVYSSRESWEQLWGAISNPKKKAQYPENWLRWEDELLAPLLDGDPDEINFTAYEQWISSPVQKDDP